MTRRPCIAPGSLADRIRTAAQAGVGATFNEILPQANVLPEDLTAELKRLRAAKLIRVWGDTRARKYFWTGPNPKVRTIKVRTTLSSSPFYPQANLRGGL